MLGELSDRLDSKGVIDLMSCAKLHGKRLLFTGEGAAKAFATGMLQVGRPSRSLHMSECGNSNYKGAGAVRDGGVPMCTCLPMIKVSFHV